MTTDVERAHREALQQTGDVITKVLCGIENCRRQVAVVHETPVGPLWVGTVERVDLGGAPTGWAGRVPPARQQVVCLLAYRPPEGDWLSERIFSGFMFPPVAACMTHGRLAVDVDAVHAAVAHRKRTAVLEHRV